MAVTYTTAAARAARTREASVADRWEIALAGVSVFAIALVLTAFVRAADERANGHAAGPIVRVNAVADAKALEPALGHALSTAADQHLAAQSMFAYLVQPDGHRRTV